MTGASEGPLADIKRARLAEAKAVAQLIVDELAETLPALEAGEDQAAAALRETCAAVGKPEKRLADLEEEIARVTGQCAGWKAKLSSLTPEDRVEARVRFQAWSEELDQLSEKRDQAERDLQPYYTARNKAQAEHQRAQNRKLNVILAMGNPFGSPIAQGTRAYMGFRQPNLNHILLEGDRSHPEWETARSALEQVIAALEQTPAEAAAMMTAEMADASADMAPVPNAAEVMAADMVKLTNETMPPSRIEDHRNTPPVPRNARVEGFRQVQSLRDLGLR